MITQLGYLGFGVKDLEKWEEYATGVAGMEVSDRLADGTLYLRMDEYHHRFIMEPTGEDDIKYVGWMVPTLDALNEVAARVRAEGITVEEGTPEERAHRRVKEFITFLDPNGVRLEVFMGLDVKATQSFHSPLGVGSFVAGEQGMGHFGLVCNNVDETERFYRDVLGFRISDYIYQRPGDEDAKMSFLHVNPRHHSLALFPPGQPLRVNHVMLQLGTLDDVGKAYDIVKQRGTPIPITLGKHINDHMVSFFSTSPSGVQLEIGWGAREVDDATWVVQQHLNSGHVWGHEFTGVR